MAADPTLSGTTLGRYRLGPLLGRGGMGEVYRADDLELGRAVAIKVLPAAFTGDPERLARFVQEARTASALNHPHLVAIYEIGQASPDRPVHFIAMELVQGETLREVLDGRRADLRRLLDYLAQAADALAAAHAAGIVHRDLKPENVMVAHGGYAKVLDFGLAKLRADAPGFGAAADGRTMTAAPRGPGPATSPGVVMGTVGYMSPEQAQGLAADHRSDIFSFGCILYEAATGVRPFTGASAIDTLHRIVHVQPTPPAQLVPSCPPELQRIVRKCLAKDPGERYQTMKDVALDLRELHRELSSGSSPALPAAAPAPRGTRRLWMLAAGAALAVLAATAFWLAQEARQEAARGALALERLTASGNVIDAVISPDSHYLAYVESEGGRQRLLVRQTRGARPLELVAVTGGFWGLEFSPDGTSIYYAVKSHTEALGALYSVPLLGGTPRLLLSVIDSKVTFSPDGRQLAYLRVEPDGTGASSLMIAGAQGENPRALVTKRPPEFLAPGFFTAASWSPDGQRLAVPLRSSASRDARLAIFGVDGTAQQVFPHQFAEAAAVAWLPDGTGLIVAGRIGGMFTTGNGGQLWLQPYPAGEIRRITADMLEYRTVSVTADGHALVTVAFEASARLSLLPLEGGAEQRLPEDRYAGGTGVAWGPDGRTLLYVKNVRGTLQIWRIGADGSDAQEVLSGIQPGGIAVSFDGRSIVYGAEREDGGGLWRADSDGSNPTQIARVPAAAWISMSPDGRGVYFTSSHAGPPSTYLVPIEGGEPTLVAPRLERAVPSPDGQLLAGVYRETPQSPVSIGVLEAASGRVVRTFPDFSLAGGSSSFAWLPDGSALLYTAADRTTIWKQPVEGGPRQPVTPSSDQTVVRFALSPDGRTLALCRGTMTRDAVLLTHFR